MAARPNAPTPEMMAEGRSRMFQNQLKLDGAQYKAVYEAELDFARHMEVARANGGHPGPGQITQMVMAKDQRFKTIMTPDQYTKYQAMNSSPSAPQPGK